MESVLLDLAGHRRSPVTMPGYHRGRAPRNKGEQYPADPPTVEEIVAVMRKVGDRSDGHRLRALIVLLWRAGLRISEALALQESDLNRSRGAVLVRRGKGGKRREVGMDRWAWEQLDPWLDNRQQLPIGALLCVIHGPTAGRRWEASAARKQLHHAAQRLASGVGSQPPQCASGQTATAADPVGVAGGFPLQNSQSRRSRCSRLPPPSGRRRQWRSLTSLSLISAVGPRLWMRPGA